MQPAQTTTSPTPGTLGPASAGTPGPAPANAPVAARGITGFTLKLAALAGMTANHVAHVFIAQLPVFAAEALYWLGGLTFPIMAFLLVEGYRHTSSVLRYLARLLAFAALSQAPFTLLFGWTGNIFFTLAIGLAVVWIWDAAPARAAGPAALAVGLVLSLLCDWAILGPTMVFAFWRLRTHPRGILLTMLIPFATMAIPAAFGIAEAFAMANGGGSGSSAPGTELANVAGFLASFQQFSDATRMAGLPLEFTNALLTQVCQLGYALVGFTLATVLLLRYNGRRGRPLKWAFYAYYPVHLLVIWLVRTALAALA